MVATVQRTIYHNQENGYTVLSVKEKDKTFTTICNLPFTPDKGQKIRIEGEWITDAKYGQQLKATKIELNDPTTESGIKEYLSSGIIAGIGPATAERIVGMFGSKTLATLDQCPTELLKVKGIGDKTLGKIAESWKEKREGARVITELCELGLSVTYATKVYKKYGSTAPGAVKENPYRLAEDIWGIGFKKADEVAKSIGFEKNHPFRIKSGLIYLLKEAQNEGHCYVPMQEIVDKRAAMLEVEKKELLNSLEELGEEKKIVNEEGKVYLPAAFQAEKYIEEKLKSILQGSYRGIDLEIEKSVDENILTEEQIRATGIATTRKLSVITGSAGTGKTTTLRAIINCLEKNNISFRLCAPTGKAAKRISEVTGREAKTIHRLLEVEQTGKFRRNEENPLDAEVIVMDEASMIDVFLMSNILKAIQSNKTLILIGDQNQLPPVGAGNVFKDIIDSGICPVIRLTKIQRQKQTSEIIEVANNIKNGDMPYISNKRDCYFFTIQSPESIATKITKLVTQSIKEKFGFKEEEIQILSPMKRGPIGTDALNKVLQEKLREGECHKGFKLNDKVMQIRNNYKKGVFNGDIGYIRKIDKEENKITVGFEEKEVEYGQDEFNELILAYCCTVHKYQGSEAKCVIIPIHTQHYMMLKRNLIYTAVTRAKRLLVIIGTNKAMKIGLSNNSEQVRYTGLFKKK